MARVPRFRMSATPDPQPSSDATISDSPSRAQQPQIPPKLKIQSTSISGNVASNSPSSASSAFTTLADTKQYSIRHLSNVPPSLQKNINSSQYRVSLAPRSGLSIATTDRDVLVWAYGTPTSAPNAKTLALPESVGPYPHAAIVSGHQSNGNEVGLVLVSRHGGKIVYWDSLDVMHAYGFRKDRHTVETSITGVYDSDEVEELVEVAGAGGFIVRMRSGKLALLGLRDTRGRISVKTTLLTFEPVNGAGLSGGSGGGFFAGLKNAFFSGPPRNAVAVRTAASANKGAGKVVMGTKSSILIWDVDWTGQHRFKGEVQIQEQIQEILMTSQREIALTELVDLDVARSDGSKIDLLALIVKVEGGRRYYSIAEITINQNTASTQHGFEVEISRIVACPPLAIGDSDQNPKLVVVEGAFRAALIVFPTAIVLTCFGPVPFQDLIFFRDQTRGVIASKAEELPSHARVHRGSTQGHGPPQGHFLLALATEGVLRLSIEESAFQDQNFRPTLAAQERFELAAFYGSIPGNPIDFLSCDHLTYNSQEVEHAATSVSGRVVLAGVKNLRQLLSPGVHSMTSAEMSALYAQSTAGSSNILNLASQLNPDLSTATRWTLLADFERIEVAHRILEKGTDGIEFEIPPDHEIDRTVGLAELLIPRMCLNMTATLDSYKSRNPPALSQLVSRAELASRIFLSLETAFKVREAKAAAYGIRPANFEDSMLTDGLESAPEFWTSTTHMIDLLQTQVETSREILQLAGVGSSNKVSSSMRALAESHIRLVDLACRVFVEHIRWCEVSEFDEVRKSGHLFRQSFEDRVRSAMIRPLAKFGLTRPGLEVAERYRDMETLSYFLLEQLVKADAEVADTQKRAGTFRSDLDMMLDGSNGDAAAAEAEAALASRECLRDLVERYFETFNTHFSDRFFEAHVNANMLHSLVTGKFCDFSGGKEAVGEFLHRKRFGGPDGTLHPVVWVFDALRGAYSSAASTLFQVAQMEKLPVAKTADLAISKVLSCDYEVDPDNGTMVDASRNVGLDYTLDVEFRAARVQETLHNSLNAATQRILSKPSHRSQAIDAIVDSFAPNLRQAQSAKLAVVKKELEQLLTDYSLSVEAILDLLTLLGTKADSSDGSSDHEWAGYPLLDSVSRFSSAFAILQPAIQSGSCGYLPKLVLKRLILKDDWISIINRLSAKRASDPMANIDIATGSTSLAELSSTLLYRLIVSSPVIPVREANVGPTVVGIELLQLIRKIVTLSEHEYSNGDVKQRYKTQFLSLSPTGQGLSALCGAGTAPDLASRFGEQLALGLGAETEKDDRLLSQVIAAGGDNVVGLCLKAAEAALGRSEPVEG